MNKTVTVNARKLKPLLRPVYQIINTSGVLPVLECFKVEVGGGKINISATNLECVVALTIDTEVSEEFSFLVDAKSFSHFINNSIEAEVSITHCDNKTTLSSGGFKARIVSDNIDNYVKYPVIEAINNCTLPAKDLIGSMAAAMHSVSSDDLRPAMTGVYIEDYAGELMCVSTDAHRMYFNGVIKTPETMAGIKAIIPKKSCQVVINAIKGGDVDIQFDTNHVVFKNHQYEITTRLIEAKYPDYNRVMQRHEFKFGIKRSQLVAFLKISQRFISASTNQLNITVSNDDISCAGDSGDYDVDCDYKLPVYNLTEKVSEPFTFSINTIFLQEALKINSRDEYVTIEHSKMPMKPMVIDGCLLLMPLMLNN